MMRIPNVDIILSYNEKDLIIGDEGYVGMLQSGTAVLQVVAPENFAAFHVDGQKNIHLKKYYEEKDERRRFEMKVRIEKDQHGVPCTKYKNNNNMRLLEFGEDHQFTFWEIALISQNGNFFLTVQPVYEEACFTDGKRVVCPYFEDPDHEWPQLVEILRTVFQEVAKTLPPVEEYVPDEPIDPATLADNTGDVLWWSFSQNYGIIMTPKGVANAHWTEAPVHQKLRYLEKGEKVQYKDLKSYGERYQAYDITRIT
jgi:hypothetical protein